MIRIRVPFVVCVVVGFVLLLVPPASAIDWKPIDPAHLALKAPKVDPTADAEALLWEVRVSDRFTSDGGASTVFENYVRVKIFTDRGREAFATVDIPYYTNVDVTSVDARTVRPDGSIVELKGSDIHRRTILKTNDVRVRTVSFAVPAIAPGVIVEYRWNEEHHDSLATNLRLRFSREIPVHEVRYYVKPLTVPGYSMTAWPFNAQFNPPEKQRDGFAMVSLSNVPATVDEEYGLPSYERRPWVFLGYEPVGRSTDPNYAKKFSKELHDEYSRRTKSNPTLRALAAEAVAGVTTDAARIAALVRVARQKVRRVDTDTVDAAELRKLKEAKNAGDVLQRGVGTGDDVLLVFLALANAAGMDVRLAAIASRADLFPPSLRPHPAFMPGRIAAIRSGNDWLFADPANEYGDGGALPWEYEYQRASIADPNNAVNAFTPLSQATYSVKKRSGTFRLLEDGTLEGDVRTEYTGHWENCCVSRTTRTLPPIVRSTCAR